MSGHEILAILMLGSFFVLLMGVPVAITFRHRAFAFQRWASALGFFNLLPSRI